jgi:hypothetical protein
MTNLPHLARRFIGSIGSRRPDPADQVTVAGVLSPREAEVFWSQPVADLAHAMRGVAYLERAAAVRSDLTRAFLLHDIGKRHARLGTLGRSLATALDWVGLARTSRQRAYLGHGEAGARELEAMGCEALVVAFARYHHALPPTAINSSDWTLLVEADRA